MKVLGIDTSAVVCTAALIEDEKILAARTVSDGLTHSETLLPLVKEIMEEQNTRLSDLDCIAISHGPGSFTGLRIGISSVKGLAVSANIPCIGVSTLEALAQNGKSYEGFVICAVMDARRGEFYNALFSVRDSVLVRICEDRAIHGAVIAEELTSYEKVLILGDGAGKFVQQNPQYADSLAPVDICFQSGASVAKLALSLLNQGKTISCQEISPRYLRLPQAEREWNEKHK